MNHPVGEIICPTTPCFFILRTKIKRDREERRNAIFLFINTAPRVLVGVQKNSRGMRPLRRPFRKRCKLSISGRKNWRRGGDSNSRDACTPNSFRDYRIQPLCHLSAGCLNIRFLPPDKFLETTPDRNPVRSTPYIAAKPPHRRSPDKI